MAIKEQFVQEMKGGYTFAGEKIKIGRAVFSGEVVADADIYLPLKTCTKRQSVESRRK